MNNLRIKINFSDCGDGDSLVNGLKTITRSITSNSTDGNSIVEQEIAYSCNSGFLLFPNETTKTCEIGGDWTPSGELSCLKGNVCRQSEKCF